MLDIKAIANMKNECDRFFRYCERKQCPVALYGAGGCDWAVRYLGRNGMIPQFIIDRDPSIKSKNEVEVISMEEAQRRYKESTYIVLIATPMYAEEVENSLKQFMAEENIFCFECELYYSFIYDLNLYRKYLMQKEEALNEFYNTLKDDLSRKTLENVLMGRISGDLKYFREVRVPNQYFADGIVNLPSEGVFLDVGASWGDTLLALDNATDGRFEKVYCFEPDKEAFSALRKNAQAYGERVILFNKGAWDKEDTLYFHEDPSHGASRIVAADFQELNVVPVDSLDHMVSGQDHIMHIKMDIEGVECKALTGAKKIIQRDKPILAICVYHRNEDLLEIPKLIKSLVPEYTFYLRHHNVAGTETVLYAVVRK